MDFIILLMFIILVAFYTIPYKMEMWNKIKSCLELPILLMALIIFATGFILIATAIMLCILGYVVIQKIVGK